MEFFQFWIDYRSYKQDQISPLIVFIVITPVS